MPDEKVNVICCFPQEYEGKRVEAGEVIAVDEAEAVRLTTTPIAIPRISWKREEAPAWTALSIPVKDPKAEPKADEPKAEDPPPEGQPPADEPKPEGKKGKK